MYWLFKKKIAKKKKFNKKSPKEKIDEWKQIVRAFDNLCAINTVYIAQIEQLIQQHQPSSYKQHLERNETVAGVCFFCAGCW